MAPMEKIWREGDSTSSKSSARLLPTFVLLFPGSYKSLNKIFSIEHCKPNWPFVGFPGNEDR